MKKYSYVTLLTNDSYTYGVILLAESMKKVNTEYPLLVFITEDVSQASIEILKQLKIKYELVDKIEIPEKMMAHNEKIDRAMSGVWKYCWTKFWVFDKTEFDKIIFLDADIMLLKNIDNLFQKPHMTSALDGEYFNLWPDWDHFNAGCFVVEPSHELFLDILNYGKNYKTEDFPDYVIADQELLNLYYKDWPQQKELHLNKYYNVFAPYIWPEITNDIKENAYFIHYVGRKPWTFWIRSNRDLYDEYFYTIGRQLIKDKVKILDWDQITNKNILTVYAICKNEKENIKKWLNSFEEADYVCILDTGSDDGTWELLQKEKKKRKNLIIDQKIITPWRFDVARNESMKLIPKETSIYFMADLDEVIKEKGWSNKIKKEWHPGFSRGSYTYNRDVDKKTDTVIRTIKEYRIHSKEWSTWVNVVHEALINHKGQKKFFEEECTPIDIVVWHYPKENKQTHYIELCEKDLEEYPDDYLMRLQLAIEYEIVKKYDKALEHFSFIIRNSQNSNLQLFEIARCYFGIGRILLLNNDNRAFNYFREGRLIDPTYIDNYILEAEDYLQKNNYQLAINLCETAMKECKATYWCNVFDCQTYNLYNMLGVGYYNIGNKLMSLSYFILAKEKNKYNEDINNHINIIITQLLQ